MTRSERVVALVVGGVDYGEADRVVHVLTRRGRLSLFAHGARKSRRRFAGALEPFTTIAMTVEARTRAGMPAVSSASVERARLGLTEDLAKLALASYVIEVASAVALEGDPSDEVYELTESVLERLLNGPATIAVQRAFELRLIDALGYRPRLDACVVCGAPIGATAYLDFHRGGTVCEAHRERAHPIGPKTIEWTERVLEGARPFEELAGVSVEWADRASRKLTGPAGELIATLVARPLKSAALLAGVAL